jgi:hypothetical protein
MRELRPLLAVLLGAVAFQGLNEAYGVVSLWRGYLYAAPFSSKWTVVGLVAGPLFGVAAGLARHGKPIWRVLGVTPLSAVLLGEGVWALQTIATTTSPIYWTLEIALSAVFMTVAIGRTRLRWPSIALTIGVWLAGEFVYWALIDVVL